MEFLDRLHLPRRLSSRVWLVSLPSALVSFEKQQNLPKLPIGAARLIGLPLIAVGIGLAVWARRRGEAVNGYSGPMSNLAKHPATAGGIIALAGLALLMQSTALAAYSVGLLLASETDALEIDEPDLEGFFRLGR
jgi:hypothetical protein